jgi:hypothetical protein
MFKMKREAALLPLKIISGLRGRGSVKNVLQEKIALLLPGSIL